jgi:hypothetical protein
MNVASVFDRFGERYMAGALSFSPVLKIGPYPTPGTPGFNVRLEPDIACPRPSAPRQDVAHVARRPGAAACCRHAASIERVSDWCGAVAPSSPA